LNLGSPRRRQKYLSLLFLGDQKTGESGEQAFARQQGDHDLRALLRGGGGGGDDKSAGGSSSSCCVQSDNEDGEDGEDGMLAADWATASTGTRISDGAWDSYAVARVFHTMFDAEVPLEKSRVYFRRLRAALRGDVSSSSKGSSGTSSSTSTSSRSPAWIQLPPANSNNNCFTNDAFAFPHLFLLGDKVPETTDEEILLTQFVAAIEGFRERASTSNYSVPGGEQSATCALIYCHASGPYLPGPSRAFLLEILLTLQSILPGMKFITLHPTFAFMGTLKLWEQAGYIDSQYHMRRVCYVDEIADLPRELNSQKTTVPPSVATFEQRFTISTLANLQYYWGIIQY